MKYRFKKRRWRWLAAGVDLFGGLFRLIASRRPNFPKDPRSVLVVRLDHLGDLVRASSIPQLIKETYPNTKVIFLTNSAGAELLEGNPYIDEVIRFEPKWYQMGNHSAASTGPSFLGLVRILKQKNLQAALLPRGDVRENLLVKLAGVPHRIGYGITGGGFLLSQEVLYKSDAHEDVHTLDILHAIGVEVRTLRPRVYSSGKISHNHRVSPHAVLIQLEAGTPAKEWDKASKQQFLEACAKTLPDKPLVFVGQSRETKDLVESIMAQHKPLKWLDLIGQTSIAELKALVAESKLFFGFDSGPAHMACAAGLPTLMVYSGTNELAFWQPTADHATVFQNNVDCSPCHLAKCNVPGHPCMAGVSVDRVIHWIKERV